MVEVVLMLVGRLFQAAGPATLKARSPKFVHSIHLRMFSNPGCHYQSFIISQTGVTSVEVTTVKTTNKQQYDMLHRELNFINISGLGSLCPDLDKL